MLTELMAPFSLVKELLFWRFMDVFFLVSGMCHFIVSLCRDMNNKCNYPAFAQVYQTRPAWESNVGAGQACKLSLGMEASQTKQLSKSLLSSQAGFLAFLNHNCTERLVTFGFLNQTDF